MATAAVSGDIGDDDKGGGYGGGRWQRWHWWQAATAGGGGRHGAGKGGDCRSGCQVLWDKMRSEIFDYFEVFLVGSTEDTNKKKNSGSESITPIPGQSLLVPVTKS